MDKIYIADLAAKPVRDYICLRVVRKWSFDGNKPGGPIIFIGLVLADEKGDSIFGQILTDDVTEKGHLLENGKTYIIKNFTVRTSKSDYVPFQRQYMIQFTSFTKIKELKDPPVTFPTYVYHLTVFSEIDPVASYKRFTDVLGIIVSVGNLQSKALRTTETTANMREIMIQNSSGDELKITLWGDHAAQFNIDEFLATDSAQSIVVLFVGCLPRGTKKNPQLSGGSGCCWYFNPDIKEAYPLYDSLKHRPIIVKKNQESASTVDLCVAPKILDYKTLKQLNDERPFKFPVQGYKCTITVSGIPEGKRWSYLGCKQCKKSAYEATSPFKCTKCEYTEYGPLYMFSFVASDGTGEGNFLAYNEEARLMIRREAETLVRHHRDKSGLPQEMRNIISKKFTLSVGLTPDSYTRMDVRTYVVKTVLIDHEAETYRENRALASYSTPRPSASAVPQLPGSGSEDLADTQTAMTGALTVPDADAELHTPTPTATTDALTVVQTSGQKEQTPPPTIVETDKTEQCANLKDKTGQSAVRRELFAQAQTSHALHTNIQSSSENLSAASKENDQIGSASGATQRSDFATDADLKRQGAELLGSKNDDAEQRRLSKRKK